MAKILVVEDNEAMLQLLDMVLKAEDFEVFTVCNGSDALDTTRFINPDIILTDMMMPVMDGLEFIDRYKGPARVIGMTASPRYKAKAKELGVECISKPFGIYELVNLLKTSSLLVPTPSES